VDECSVGAVSAIFWRLDHATEFREGLAFNLAQFDRPPAAWDEAIHIA
jgi:hypothetical protein